MGAKENGNTEITTQEKRQLVTDYSKGIFGTSDNFLMAMQMAKALATSTIVPKEFQGNASNCLIAIEQAQRLHMSPMMIMQNMYVIYGRPSWSSKFLIAMINNSGKYDQPLMYEEKKGKDGKPFSCMAWTTKDGEKVEGMTVDMDMAKAEGWIDKNGSKWKTLPQLMLRYRAASFFSSLNCPEITMGLYTEDEVTDMIADTEYSIADAQDRMLADIAGNTATAEIPALEPALIPDRDPEFHGQPFPEELKKEPVSAHVDEEGQMAIPGF